jgi:phytoene synthase
MQDAFARCEALVRAGDKDRFLASLFAPAECRAALHAIYAFNLEIARVAETVHEPLAGEIRLQWWSDAIAGKRDDAGAHPVAAALLATMVRYGLPAEPLFALIDGHRFDLYRDPMQNIDALEDYARKTASGVTALAAVVLGSERAPVIEEMARGAGTGYAIAGLLKAFPIHAARGQLFLPLEVLDRHGVSRDDIAARRATAQLRGAFSELRVKARAHLAKARDLIDRVPAAALPAFLPVAVSGLLLRRMDDPRHDPFVPIEIAQWRRQWRLWRAARRPALMFG